MHWFIARLFNYLFNQANDNTSNDGSQIRNDSFRDTSRRDSYITIHNSITPNNTPEIIVVQEPLLPEHREQSFLNEEDWSESGEILTVVTHSTEH